MTSWINGGISLPVTVHARTDLRHADEFYFGNVDYVQPPEYIPVNLDIDKEFQGFVTPWWPSKSSLGTGWDGLSESGIITIFNNRQPWYSLGANGRLGFVGTTRDQYGSPLGNCTVRCIRASTDEMVSKVESDANGFYIATTPYNDAHFLVIHSTDGQLAGATVNTALPA